MLFSTFYAQSLLLLGMRSVAMAEPIPSDDDLGARTVPDDLYVLKTFPLDITADVNLEIDTRAVHPRLRPRALNADGTEALRLHNAARAKKKVKALVWDDALYKAAKSWAKHLANTSTFAHSPSSDRPNQGENLAYVWSSGTVSNPLTVGTNAWLAEVKNYHNEVIPKGNFSMYGHYTQCMWNTTTKVGISSQRGKNGAYYIVGRYSPAGNIVGRRPY